MSFLRDHSSFSLHRAFLFLLLFAAAYMISVSVRAQGDDTTIVVGPGDAIQLNDNNDALITGTIVSAAGRTLIIDSAGRQMRVDLSDVKTQGQADELFRPGMAATVNGTIEGDHFGMPLIRATSITVSESPASVIRDQ